MEFDFTSLAFGGEQHIVCWDANKIRLLKPADAENLAKMLEVFGKKSAVAQGLQTPVTDILRLRSTDQRLYLHMYRQSTKTVVTGGLKVGTKRLYIRTATADLREMEPVCVLDFYVHESCQRQGVGKVLFEHFLACEGVDPACIAYDRPSPKLLAFLRKHYGLQDYVPQSNNYVVFNRYFELNPSGAGAGSRHSTQAGRQGSRGSAPSGTPMHPHPLHGAPRATPPPHVPGLSPGHLSAPSPSAAHAPTSGLPQSGQSPTWGARWAAANNFGGAGAPPPPFPSQPPAGHAEYGGSQEYGAGYASGGGGGGEYGDSLDAFSHQQHQYQCLQSPPRGPAPWEGASGSAGPGPGYPYSQSQPLPPATGGSARSGFGSRPPWAVDEPGPPGGGTAGSSGRGGAGMGVGVPAGFGSSGSGGYAASQSPARTPGYERHGGLGAVPPPGRSPLHGILAAGGGGGAEAGPHTRALQEQLTALTLSGGGGGPPHGAAATPHGAHGQGNGRGGRGVHQGGGGAAAHQPGAPGGGRGGVGPVPGSSGGSEAGRSAARIMAVAQRSGAGAADCLVW